MVMVQSIPYRCCSDMDMVAIEGCRAEVWLYESATAASMDLKNET